MTVWRMRIAYCTMFVACNTTNTHSEYVTFIAFPLQQWLHERVSMLRYTLYACLVCTSCIRNIFVSGKETTWSSYVYWTVHHLDI